MDTASSSLPAATLVSTRIASAALPARVLEPREGGAAR